ncbi:MAG TPA: hypothetical protein VER79_09370, partial [Candidatus Limnocylindrales bacterium]|nr:hypothetical protein [Candidatus Limnocylindrales bacterium]
MGLRLLIGPVGSGKTGRALETLQALKAAEPLAQVWALMATERQIIAFRNRLLTPGRGVLNLNFFNFHLLYEQITQAAGWPQRVLHSAPRAALLREVLRDRWRRPGAIFRPLPGFVEVIGAFIDELKQWQITPAQFAVSAGDDAKLTELAAIYTDYQARLEELRLLDREGLGMFALECLRENPALAADVDLLLVDGFDQFNPLHAALIAALSQRAASATVSLTTPDGPGSETAGFSRFTLARGRLLQAYRAAQGLPEMGPDDGDLLIEHMPAPVEAEPARRAVRHLVDQIWSPLPERAAACAYVPSALCAPGVSFLEAPDLVAETAAVLRRVKALLLGEAGVGAPCRPDDILIAVRDWGRYGPHLNALGRRYALPLSLHEGAPLAENPAVAALLRLLALPESDYRRQDVLDAVASPYVSIPDLPEDGVTLLEQAARAAFVLSGRGEWLDALAALANGLKPLVDEDEDATEDGPMSAPAARFRSMAAALEGLFEAVELAPIARVEDFTDSIDALIGADEAEALPLEDSDAPESHTYTLGLLAAVRADSDPERLARDLKALHALKGVLRALRASAVLLSGMGITTTDQVTRAEFLADLRRAIAQVTAEDTQGSDGRVLATTVADARGLPHPHVFILGLSESIFPAPVPEDPLLLESERRSLQDKGLPLPLRAERSDDAGLFYELAGLAGSTLTLSRPALRDGAEWIESALWRTAAASFDEPLRTTLKVGAVTPSGECATQEEAALAIAASAGNDLPPLEGVLAGWLASADGLAWARLGRAHAIEASRLSRQSHYDTYAGRLADGEIIAQLAERFGPDYAWSASQLNTLGECGFRFFSQRLLGLNTLEPPKVGL